MWKRGKIQFMQATFTETNRTIISADKNPYSNWIKAWLITGLIMVFFQVVIGGITRLTGSGLSITKWEIVLGTFPPLNSGQWEEAFDLYKATPQYEKINAGMSMQDFKFIYFWEYIHRLWARLMGFVFLIPFITFWLRGMFDKMLKIRLVVVFLLAALVASFGWIMVASGLINRPWVNAYKLTMHLSLALVLYAYLYWTTLKVLIPNTSKLGISWIRNFGLSILVLLATQIVLGGIMSGMKAGLNFPTWPAIDGGIIPKVLLDSNMWTLENFENYDNGTAFMPALIQFLHRNLAYLLTLLISIFVIIILKLKTNPLLRISSFILILLLATQVLLGILTLLNCIGRVPLLFGVLHQAFALLLLSAMLLQYYQIRTRN